jgi:heterotetrameric sarcosine oxidase gamma subunit
MTDLQRTSALQAPTFEALGFELRELPNVSKVRVQLLRGASVSTPVQPTAAAPDKVPRAGPHRIQHAPNTALGDGPHQTMPDAALDSMPRQFPTSPNTSLGTEPIVLWKAPGDWLAYSQNLDAAALSNSMRQLSAGAPCVITDVSAASIVLELRGARVLDVLMRDCTLDLEGGAIQPGDCAQTAFAQVSVMIHRPVDVDAWRLFVERSVAVHVWDWITQMRVDQPYLSGASPV